MDVLALTDSSWGVLARETTQQMRETWVLPDPRCPAGRRERAVRSGVIESGLRMSVPRAQARNPEAGMTWRKDQLTLNASLNSKQMGPITGEHVEPGTSSNRVSWARREHPRAPLGQQQEGPGCPKAAPSATCSQGEATRTLVSHPPPLNVDSKGLDFLLGLRSGGPHCPQTHPPSTVVCPSQRAILLQLQSKLVLA